MKRKWREGMPADDEAAKKEAQWYYDFGNCVAAAIRTCTARRWAASGGVREDGVVPDPYRTAGIVTAASDKLEAKDAGAMHDVFAGQALVLDEIFTQDAHMAAANAYSFPTFMSIALKAQSQCRWTLKALQAMNECHARPASRNGAAAGDPQEFFEQTIANGKTSA